MANNLIGKLAVVACDGYSWWCKGLADQTILRAATTLILPIALAIAWYFWWGKKFVESSRPPLPPGPLGFPIVGNLPFLQRDLHQYFQKLSQLYGPIIKLKLGSKICIVVGSASVAKEVLKDHDAIFANRDPPIAAIIGSYGGSDIAWRSSGPEWRKLRGLVVRELMSKTGLDGCYVLHRREVREMMKYIHGKVGEPLNIGDQLFLTILNVLTSTLWGGSMQGEERIRLGIEFRQLMKEYVELLAAPNISDLFPKLFLSRFDLNGVQSKMKKTLIWFDKIFESVIAQRRKADDNQDQPQKLEEGERKEERSKDFLQLILELNQQEDHKSSLSMNEVKALLLDMVVGGTDSTSTILEWAMTELLRCSDKRRRAMEELDRVVGGDQNVVEESHLPQLHYLDAVIKETLRLHPPLPLLVPHTPSKTCTIAGYTIPKESRVLFNVWAIQRDSEFWEDDPSQFEPERFLRSGTNDSERGKYDYLGNNFHFIPFGSGRRICVGIPMAEKMLKHVLAALLHSFEWKLVDGEKPDTQETFGIVLKKTKPLVAIPVARLSNPEQYCNKRCILY